MALVSASPTDRLRAPLAAWIAAVLGLCLVYAVIFVTTEAVSPGPALLIAAGNVAPMAVLAAALRLVLPPLIFPRAMLAQALWHLGLAAGFTLAWYPASR